MELYFPPNKSGLQSLRHQHLSPSDQDGESFLNRHCAPQAEMREAEGLGGSLGRGQVLLKLDASDQGPCLL